MDYLLGLTQLKMSAISTISASLDFDYLDRSIQCKFPKCFIKRERHTQGGFGDIYRVLGPGEKEERSVGVIKVPGGKMVSKDKSMLPFALLANRDELKSGLDLEDTGFVPETFGHFPIQVNVDGAPQDTLNVFGEDITPHAIFRRFIYGIRISDAIEGGVISIDDFDTMFIKFHEALHDKGYKNMDGQASNFKIDLENDNRFMLLDTRMGRRKEDELEEAKIRLVEYARGCYKALRILGLEETIPDDVLDELCRMEGINRSDLS